MNNKKALPPRKKLSPLVYAGLLFFLASITFFTLEWTGCVEPFQKGTNLTLYASLVGGIILTVVCIIAKYIPSPKRRVPRMGPGCGQHPPY
jgi:hypothetical protein